MNLLGKMFILLIFVMSITFMSFSAVVYLTPIDWKKRSDEVAAKLKDAQTAAQKLTESRDEMVRKLNEEINNRAVTISTLTVKVDELDKENKKFRDDLAQFNDQKEQKIGDVKRLHTTMAEARAEVDGLRKDLQAVQKEWAGLYSDLVAKTDEAHGLAMKLANFRSVNKRLEIDHSDAENVLRKHGLEPEKEEGLQNNILPKGIRGTVTEVRPNGWVEISVGSDSGVANGHRFDVIRNIDGRKSNIGKIEIVLCETDCSAARILPEYSRGIVQQDDIVENCAVNELTAR